jgi:hypothetical protein
MIYAASQRPPIFLHVPTSGVAPGMAQRVVTTAVLGPFMGRVMVKRVRASLTP